MRRQRPSSPANAAAAASARPAAPSVGAAAGAPPGGRVDMRSGLSVSSRNRFSLTPEYVERGYVRLTDSSLDNRPAAGGM
ncbi:hypothetical protein GCM10010124_25710 [Pilimelia terevasa]|uniref:Uncharacterized protein n=1 Tax=Pilimelia terevasa TaxID=53372 RepID=A0A8J3BSC2_9ACTN|nr:hypothetical protein GCM10010124_25710 [Pilimelia terevasa]